MQHKGEQCQADKHGGEDVKDGFFGFAGHGVGSLQWLRVVDVLKYNPLGSCVNTQWVNYLLGVFT